MLTFLLFPPFDTRPLKEVSKIAHFLKVVVRYDNVRLSGCNMPKNNWENLYLQTVLEVSGQKMPERIAATRKAITGRLRNLEHDSDHHTERHEMEKALTALKTLEAETRNW